MAKESSFDIVVEVDSQEIDNAVNQSVKEIANRWDFRGSNCKFELDKTAKQINLLADDDMKMTAMKDVLAGKLVKRGISPLALDYQEVEQSAGSSLRLKANLIEGIPQDKAKDMVKAVKEAKLKAQISIQGEKVRVTSKSKDVLQDVMQLVKSLDHNLDLKFSNYR